VFVGSRAHVDNMSFYEAYGHFMVESGVIENVWLGYERRGKEHGEAGYRRIRLALERRWNLDSWAACAAFDLQTEKYNLGYMRPTYAMAAVNEIKGERGSSIWTAQNRRRLAMGQIRSI
jgi:hypothetical protein